MPELKSGEGKWSKNHSRGFITSGVQSRKREKSSISHAELNMVLCLWPYISTHTPKQKLVFFFRAREGYPYIRLAKKIKHEVGSRRNKIYNNKKPTQRHIIPAFRTLDNWLVTLAVFFVRSSIAVSFPTSSACS